MAYVTTEDGAEIYYKDWGSADAQPIVFHHGWPSRPTTGTRSCLLPRQGLPRRRLRPPRPRALVADRHRS
jgi:pimeloyl-ACP methyl ester carboxylesterase